MLVYELIQQGADEKIALYEKDAKYSYAQLKKKVGQYRNFLYAQGIRPTDNVALFAKNSADFIFSYLAVVSLGGAVVPLNTMLTSREASFILADAKARYMITDRTIALDAGDSASPTMQILIQDINEESSHASYPAAPVITMQETDPCVILYTSGTTGRPKGALLSHRNLIADAAAFSKVIEPAASDNTLCVLPMFHSFGWTCCVTTPLYNGASITIVETFSPREVITTIREMGVTIVMGVPAMYSYYASLAKPADLAGVRLFVAGGASLPMEVINSFDAKTGKKVIEGYGLSEASPVVAFNPLGATKPGSIGLPLPGVEVKTVTSDGRETVRGEIGELIVKGPIVMLEYYGLPGETEEALRDGWLYTGDLAYKDEDGYIFIVDRKKDLVIVSGLNVYPREVEEIIYQHPAVQEAAVIGVPDKKRGETVRAFIVPKEGLQLNKKELLSFLKKNLASYKLPRGIIEVDAMPKTSTGKISKKDLRQMYDELSC
ncbi:MAG: long-chain fatty acid--CoA ligase [Desulfotomaculaceae bacterium]|nr:long-chain fatty acid--CoA ligase [Desulfotomaculaceae bacterium]